MWKFSSILIILILSQRTFSSSKVLLKGPLPSSVISKLKLLQDEEESTYKPIPEKEKFCNPFY